MADFHPNYIELKQLIGKRSPGDKYDTLKTR